MRWVPTKLSLVLLVLLVLILGQGVSLAAEPADAGPEGLVSPWPLESIGSVSLQTQSGAVVTNDPESITSTVLHAEQATFTVDWRRGYEMQAEDQGLLAINEEFGQYPLYAEDAEIRFQQFPGPPTLFVVDEQDRIDLRMDTQDGFNMFPEYEQYAVTLGNSPDRFSLTGNAPYIGYWYLKEGAFAQIEGTSNLRVEGDFTLAVENVEIHVEENDDEWTHWTGYWKEDPDAPVTRVEFRLTVIEVTNGTLVAPHRSPFTLLARDVEATVDGILSSPGVTGRILQKGKAFIFDEDPMELKGSGKIEVNATTTRRATLSELHLVPSGEYDVSGASHVETLEGEEPDTWPGTLLSWTIGGLTAAAMTTAGLARLGYLPPATPAARHRRHGLWVRRGQDAADHGRWNQASWCFRKATRIKGDDPVAWFEWAHSELEAGNHLKADQIARRANRVPGIDPMDLLDLRASAAWERGDQEALEAHLTELAKGDLTIAQGLVHDLEIDTSGFSQELRELLGADDEEEAGLDGYA